MKKIAALLGISVVTLSLLVGCGAKKADAPQSSQQQPQQTQQAQQQPQMSDQDKAAEVVRQFLTGYGQYDYRKKETFYAQEKLLDPSDSVSFQEFRSGQDKAYEGAVTDKEVMSIVEPATVQFLGQQADKYAFKGSIRVVGTNVETKQKVEELTFSGNFEVQKKPDGTFLITYYQLQ